MQGRSGSHEPARPSYDYVPTAQRQRTSNYVPQPAYSASPYDTHAPQGLYNPTAMNAISTAMQPVAATVAQPKHYALEQVQWGVRVDEFQALSNHAKFVHPAAALQLQKLWDEDQNKLVSVMDENSWMALAGLDALNGVKVVNEVAEKMKTAPDDLVTINAIFISVASRYPRREDAPPAPAGIAPSMSVPPSTLPQSSYLTANINDPRMPPPQQQAMPVQLPGPAGSLSPAIQSKIDEILGTWDGLLKLEHFDERAIEQLSRMPESEAVRILTAFGRNNPSSMRNPSAYLNGCLRRAGDMGHPGGRGRRPPHRGTHRYEPY